MTASTAKIFLYGGHVRANGIRQHYLRYGGQGDPLVLDPRNHQPGGHLGLRRRTPWTEIRHLHPRHARTRVERSARRRGLQLLVAGKGGVINDADIAELKRLAPSIRVRRIDHCGHMIPFDDLEAFLEAVESFLN